MSKYALFAGAALVASATVGSAWGADLPAVNTDLSPAAAAATTFAAQGADVTPAVAGAQQIANAALKAGSLATSLGNEFSGAAPIDAGGLRGAEGGTNTTVNFSGAVTQQDLSATNTGNVISAAQITNGAISVGANAFSGFNGVGNVLLNSGNQNNIQGSLSLTVVISPALAH